MPPGHQGKGITTTGWVVGIDIARGKGGRRTLIQVTVGVLGRLEIKAVSTKEGTVASWKMQYQTHEFSLGSLV